MKDRRLWVLRALGLASAVAVAALIVLLYQPTTLPIQRVTIEGHYTHLDPRALKSALLPSVTTGFFAVDLKALTQSLMNMPWVAEVKVRRVWPDKLIIHLTQQQALAQWGNDGVMNENGTVFRPKAHSIPKGLPRLMGPPDQRLVIFNAFKAMSQVLAPLSLKIRTLVVSKRLSWRAELSNGMTLVLGQDHIVERFQRFEHWYKNIFGNDGKQVEYVDLRYTNGMAVRWKNKPQTKLH